MKKNLIFLFFILGVCMLTGCTQYAKQDPEESEDYILTEEDVFILKDGASVSLWEPYEDSLTHSYRLENGQELLEVDLPTTIDNSHSEGLEGYKTLEPKALEAALDYYNAQESKLDIEILLENAYEDYSSEKNEDQKFIPHLAEEDVSPCIETERFTGFLTTVVVPESPDYENYDETKTVTLFDRETGDVIASKDLFSISEEEAISILAKFCAEGREERENDIKSKIRFEDIVWMQDGVWMYFPYSTQTDEDLMWNVRIPYDELKDCLYPWAIPETL